MIRIIIILVMGLVGGAGGFSAGMVLRPDTSAEMTEHSEGEDHGSDADGHGDGHGDDDQSDDHGGGQGGDHGDDHGTDDGHGSADDHAEDDGHGDDGSNEIVKMNNQFIVPVVEGDRVASMVVVSISLETKVGGQEIAYSREPKLRDAFLQVLFDHANAGGFRGNFTAGNRLEILKRLLRGASRKTMGDYVVNVLITDIARQDR